MLLFDINLFFHLFFPFIANYNDIDFVLIYIKS